MGKTSIEWAATANADGSVTPGETWNPVRGCTKVSPGCANCYAETFAERWRGVPGHAYEQGFDLRLVPEKLDEPLRRKKPTTYFVNSMSDLFQVGVPDDYIDRVFAVMALAPQHTFQVLTKRAERMRAYITAASERWGDRRAGIELAMYEVGGDEDAYTIAAWPLSNVWLGVSVENQHFADERIPLLLQTPAAVRFISAEPLLEAVDLHMGEPRHHHLKSYDYPGATPWKPDWVIVGCESGHGRRNGDAYEDHASALLDQCAAAGVARFHKQMPINGRVSHDPAEWPEALRVRQMPTVTR